MSERKKPTYATTILGCVKRIRNHPDHDVANDVEELLFNLASIGKEEKDRENLPKQAAKLRAKAEAALAKAAALEAGVAE